jgi:hypothetical protein
VALWTPVNVLQLALAVVALTVAIPRLRAVLYEAPLDADAFIDALRMALAASQLGLARRIAEACLPAWPARLAARAIAALDQQRDPRPAIDEACADLAHMIWDGRSAITVLGRIANPVALIGVIIELGKASHGGEGLAGLQRGLAERIALQRSLLTFALGLGTSIVCFSAVAILQRNARLLDADLRRVAAAFERGRAGGDEM